MILARAVRADPRPPADELAETIWELVARVGGVPAEGR